jgi:4-hydroxy-tetrahydrodipicolinate synthase
MQRDRLTEQAKGVYIISATPFDETGAIDFASIDRLIEFYVNSQVSGITILGMMGEAPKLSGSEARKFLAHYVNRVADRVPVVVGVSNPGLINLAELSHFAMDTGAAGVMVAPSGGQNTERKLYQYLYDVCENLGPDVPFCYQDFPLSTSVNISVELFSRAVRDFSQLVMLKHEDWPGLAKLSKIRQSAATAETRRVSILCGNGGLYLPQELSRGADGAMTGFAYPEMLVNVVRLHQEGLVAAAEDMFDCYLPLVKHEQQPGFGLAVRKEILRRRGIISTAMTRAPGPKLTTDDHRELVHLMTRLERKLEDLALPLEETDDVI